MGKDTSATTPEAYLDALEEPRGIGCRRPTSGRVASGSGASRTSIASALVELIGEGAKLDGAALGG